MNLPFQDHVHRIRRIALVEVSLARLEMHLFDWLMNHSIWSSGKPANAGT
jgi:hypothetical protein